MGLGTLTLMAMLWAPGQAPASDVHPFNKAKMDIPITFDPTKKNTIRDLYLYCSRDQGLSWVNYQIAKPEKDSFFTFTAEMDGIYWFQMVIVDKQGKPDPVDLVRAPGPTLKILIDTKSPVIAIKSVDRIGDEVTVAWEVQEINPDWSKFLIEYRAGEGNWIPVSARPAPVGTAKFRVSQQGPVTVRIQAVDIAGNRTEMTKDLAMPANVIASSTNQNNVQQSSANVFVPNPVVPSTMVQQATIPAAVVPAATVPPTAVPPAVVPAAVGTFTPTDISAVPVLPPDAPVIPAARQEKPATNVNAAPITTPEPVFRSESSPIGAPLAVSPTTDRNQNQVNLPAAQVINVSKFLVGYDVEQKGPSGVSRAEIWITRDDGKSWQKWDSTEKTESPVTVDLGKNGNPQLEGVYGIKIVLQSGAGLSNGPPVSGEAPEMRVDLDLTSPVVKLYEPIPDPNQKDTMILRWQAVDRNLAIDPITLEWAEQADGPWLPIASNETGAAPINSSSAPSVKRLANTGQYPWKLPSNFPTHRVYIRVTARDIAGNVGEVKSPHPILVDMNKPVAKIHGIIGAPAAADRR